MITNIKSQILNIKSASQISNRNKSGFTLVELLVVISLFSILAAAGTEIFIPMVRSYNKANIQNEVNQNGNYILTLIADQIRNAKRVVAYSSDSRSSSIQIEDYDGNLTTFNRVGDNTGCTSPDPKNGYLQMSRVGRNSLTNVPLNNLDKKNGVNVENFVVDVDNSVSPYSVSISLSLSQGCATSSTVDYLARSVFSTTVTLRNY